MSSSFDNRNDILTRYNYERERRRRSTQAPVAPQMMSAHEPIVNPNANINPFQNDFTPNTNTMSMQQIAGQVAPQPQQPFLERMARGAMSLPLGVAGLAEGLTTDPMSTLGNMGQSIAKHAAETAAIASDIPMNPVYGQRLLLKGANALGVPGIGGIEPQLQQLQEERKQAYITNPLLAPLDVAGLVGAGQATSMLSKIGRKSAVPKIIADAVAPEKPKVDVPEVVQEPVRSETPIVEQPAPAPDVTNSRIPSTITEDLSQAKPRSEWTIEDYKANGWVTPDEALQQKRINKKQHEKLTYGGLTKKQHDHMMDLARKTNEETQRAGKISTAPAKVQDAGATPAQSIELGALGTPSALHSTMGAVGRVAEKSMIPIQYIAKKIDNFMEKKGLSNPFGTPEIVLKNTGIVEAFRDATAKEHSFVAEQSLKLKEILGERVTNERYLAEMFKHLDNPQAKLNKTEQALRGWFDDMLNQVNEFRVKRGEEPINYTQGYVPHIFDKAKELLDADQSIALPRKAQNRFANARVGAEGYEKDLIQALELYTRATARDMYINDALHTAIPAIEGLSKKGSKILHREVVTDPDGTTKYFNSYRLNNADMWSKRGYAEAFVREQLGLPTAGQRFLKQVGINPRTSQKVSNMATGLIYRNLLGAAIDTGVKNLSQITHTLAENGYAPTMRGIGRFLTPEGIKSARSEHLLKEFDAFLLTKDMPGVDKSKILKQFDDVVLSGPMRFTEFVNRGIAYHTALDDALKAGKAFAEAHDIALKAVRKTQFEYNKMGTSPFMRGPFTRPMAQFTTFPTKTSEMIFQWATEGATGRAKLLRYFATTGALVYGGKELGVELGNIFFDPTKTVDPDSKGGFELPISGRKVKIDLTRLGSTGFAPQGFVPTVTKPYKYISDLMEKDRTAKDRAIQGAREFAPGGRFGGKVYDVATGSEYRDERGRLIRKDTKSDAWLKLLGGRPSNQDIMRNKKEEIVKIEDEYYETRRKIIDTQLNGDIEEARQMIADFSEKYPYLASRLRKSLKQGRKDERKKKQMSSDERFMDNSMRQRIEQNL